MNLAPLEAAVRRALAGGEPGAVRVIGYGEVSAVLAWEDERGAPLACKRLPRFAGRAAYERYAALFTDYLDALRARGVVPVASALHALETEEGVVAYCVQPRLPAAQLAPAALAAAAPEEGRRLLDAVAGAVCRFVSPRRGLDAQLSNWAVTPDGLRYLDLTTPLLRDAAGRERLDTDLFLASLPWLIRGLVRRFLLAGILAHYYDPRAALLDLVANLHKERLAAWIPAALDAANARVAPPITAREARRYYRADARTWALLQRLRRLDRAWQRRVRRRVYPFLLPGKVRR